MKRCPFCAEEIQDEAVKCKHCGEFLLAKTTLPWYCRTSSLIIAFLCVGPLALPLLWLRPHLSRVTKGVVTVAVLAITALLASAMANAFGIISSYYEMLGF